MMVLLGLDQPTCIDNLARRSRALSPAYQPLRLLVCLRSLAQASAKQTGATNRPFLRDVILYLIKQFGGKYHNGTHTYRENVRLIQTRAVHVHIRTYRSRRSIRGTPRQHGRGLTRHDMISLRTLESRCLLKTPPAKTNLCGA